MTEHKTKTEYKCPECSKVYEAPQALGIHRRNAHGIKGTSAAATHYHEVKNGTKQPKKIGRPKGVTAKRRDELATIPTEAKIIHPASNGHKASRHPFSPLETAVAIAYGRWTELCREVARELELPEKHIARALSEFVQRQSS